jgi:hypothetical protein
MPVVVKGGNGFGRITATAATKIVRGIPGRVGAFTRLRKLVYLAAGTAHTITVLRSIGRTRANGAAAASQADLVVLADPGPSGNGIAANDRIAIRHAVDGVTRFYTVSAWNSGTRTITLSANLTVAVTDRDHVWMFGVEADTDPSQGEAHPIFPGTASTLVTYDEGDIGVVASNASDEPLLVIVDNATAAGTLQQTTYAHTAA